MYCSAPPGKEKEAGIGSDGLPRICKVVKPIYGMAQAGRRWQRTIFPWLVDPKRGFSQCASDPCLFHKKATVQTPDGPREEILIIGIYVDDLFVCSSHADRCERLLSN